jgi:hypothetical protein
MKKTISARKLAAIRAHAENGQGVEKEYALKLLEGVTNIPLTELPNPKHVVSFDIPYREFVASGLKRGGKDVWEELLEYAAITIKGYGGTVTGIRDTTMYATFNKNIYSFWVQVAINMATYSCLASFNVPAIFIGGDVSGLPCYTDEMEDGTKDSIFQFEACWQFTAPDINHMIYSAMVLPNYNKFVITTQDSVTWGKIISLTSDAITIQPLNHKYNARKFNRSEILTVLRCENMGGWCCWNERPDEVDAAIARYKTVYGKD